MYKSNTILGTFVQSGKVPLSFKMLVCPNLSVLLSLDGFAWKCLLGATMITYRVYPDSVKMGPKCLIFCMKVSLRPLFFWRENCAIKAFFLDLCRLRMFFFESEVNVSTSSDFSVSMSDVGCLMRLVVWLLKISTTVKRADEGEVNSSTLWQSVLVDTLPLLFIDSVLHPPPLALHERLK
jgi:hypothetical protein